MGVRFTKQTLTDAARAKEPKLSPHFNKPIHQTHPIINAHTHPELIYRPQQQQQQQRTRVIFRSVTRAGHEFRVTFTIVQPFFFPSQPIKPICMSWQRGLKVRRTRLNNNKCRTCGRGNSMLVILYMKFHAVACRHSSEERLSHTGFRFNSRESIIILGKKT